MPVNPQGKRILLWEAFVSKEAHSEEHERDAATAVMEFQRRFKTDSRFASDIQGEGAIRVQLISQRGFYAASVKGNG